MILLSSEVTGVVTWLGTILSLAGLAFTYLQASEAKVAALQAASESNLSQRAISNLQRKLSLIDAAHVGAQTSGMLHLVNTNQFIAAQVSFDQIKRTSNLLADRKTTTDTHRSGIKRNIFIISKQLALALSSNTKYKQHTLISSITGLGEFIFEVEQTISETNEPG